MAEAPIKWKIETLREIIAAPLHAQWIPTPGSQDMDWFIDMKKDGYVEGTWGMQVDPEKMQADILRGIHAGFQGGREVFSELHVTEKGKKLVDDYDSQNTFKGMWKRYHLLILGGILGIVTTLLATYLSHLYFH